MPKLLIEYKGIPVILNHSFEKIDKIIYITVYTNSDNVYIRKDFDNIEEALDFNPESSLKLTFIYINSPKQEDGNIYVEYKSIKFENNKLILSDKADCTINKKRFTIEFGFTSFTLWTLPKSFRPITYSRRKTIHTDDGDEFELLDSYYEIIPRFEDLFLETIFMLDIMSSNPGIRNKEELEAYLLQSKLKTEKEMKPLETKKGSEKGSEPSKSDEQIELENLIGLNKIKLEILELKTLAQFRKKRIEFDLPVTPSTLHMVFTGNPGTGKTTVARLLGKIYYDIGLLAENKVIEVSRGDLVGQYVGHTAPKTQKVFEDALGGILFIDEAYSLFKTGNDFGSEAVETLLKLMEDYRENIVVIIAGYPKEIEELLISNPGLKSRFSKHLHFDDYSKDELIQIFYKMVSDYNNILTDGAKYKIEYFIDNYYESGYFISNARAIRNIFEESIKKQSLRLSKIDNPSQDQMITFIDKDIPDSIN